MPVVVEKTIELGSPPDAVWPYLTDTDRMNRLLATSATYKPIEAGAKTNARFVVETRSGGFALSYEEAPFEWTAPKRFSVYRKMRSGPIRSYTYGATLEATRDRGGTKATLRLELEPVHWLLNPIVRIQSSRFLANAAELAREIDAHLREGAASPYVEPRSPTDEERLAACDRALAKRDVDPAARAALVEIVRDAPDADAVRLRPFEIASQKGIDPYVMLGAFLHGVSVGLVELRWALVCPSCRTANDQITSLAELETTSHCQLCDITYGLDLDRAVEATFRPHVGVRETVDRMYCVGGPWRTPHVLSQANVDDERAIEVPSESGRFRIFARGGATASLEIADGAPSETKLRLVAEDRFEPADARIAPSGSVVVENATGEGRHVKIEKLGYASLAATAQILSTMSEFRRLFSKDLLKPSTPVKVGHTAILFSDLTGSTALYTKAGDAAAFRLVDDHFDVLRKVIDTHRGTVVKTMGDAVMAAFVDTRACVRAAIGCIREFETFRTTHEHGELTGLKVGLFAGPCYAVNANQTLDYFGQTVNCASRVQHLAESGEIVLEESAFDGLDEATRSQLSVVEKIEAKVKGVDEPLHLVRTRPSAQGK